MPSQMRLKNSADNVSTLSDGDAPACLKVLLERDDQMQVVHVKWLATLRTVSPADFAARAIQVYRGSAWWRNSSSRLNSR